MDLFYLNSFYLLLYWLMTGYFVVAVIQLIAFAVNIAVFFYIICISLSFMKLKRIQKILELKYFLLISFHNYNSINFELLSKSIEQIIQLTNYFQELMKMHLKQVMQQ